METTLKQGERFKWEDWLAAAALGSAVGAVALGAFQDHAVLLPLVIVPAVAHRFDRRFLVACAVSAPAATVVAAIYLAITHQVNEMMGVFMVAGGFYALLVSLAVGVPFYIYRHPGLVGALWRGEIPLAQAYWRYGFALNLVFALVALALAGDAPHAVRWRWWPFYLAYFAWMAVAVWRSSKRYTGPRVWAVLARVVVALDVVRLGGQLATVVVPVATVAERERHPVVDRFDLNSTSSTYPLVTRLYGRLMERPDSLLVEIDSGFVTRQLPAGPGEQAAGLEVGLAFGLGIQYGTYGWDFGHVPLTSPQLLAPALRPGDTAQVGHLRFWIIGIDTVPLADRWLAAEVRVQRGLAQVQADSLRSYACAEENIRGPTPASRARAERMKTQYAESC